MKRYRKQMIAAGILLAVILTGNLLARKTDWFGEWYAVTVYPWFEMCIRDRVQIDPFLFEIAVFNGYVLGSVKNGMRNFVQSDLCKLFSIFLSAPGESQQTGGEKQGCTAKQ